VLIRRREGNEFEVALCDFGFNGYMNKEPSIPLIILGKKNSEFRDPNYDRSK
jgi:hypothetical protein